MQDEIDDMLAHYASMMEDVEKLVEELKEMHLVKDFNVVERGKGVLCQSCMLQVIDGDPHLGKMKEAGAVLNKSEGELQREEAAFFKNREAKNWPNKPLQEKFHRAILRALRNISDTA